jgi:hypothetical protein
VSGVVNYPLALGLAAVLAGSNPVITPLWAESKDGEAKAEKKIQVTVVAILATDQNKNVEPRLECLAKEVQKTDPALSGFRLVKCTRQEVEIGKKFDFSLVEDAVAAVAVKHGCDEEDRVGLTVKAPLVGEIAYSCACGKFFPILTRYQTKGKERLIIAIRVQPCPCKKH